jgi:hypothetical protein
MRKIYVFIVLAFLYNLGYAQIHVTITNPTSTTRDICQTDTIQFKCFDDSLGIGTTYQWKKNNVIVGGNLNNFLYSATIPSTTTLKDTIRIVVTNGTFKDSAQVIVNVLPLPCTSFTY